MLYCGPHKPTSLQEYISNFIFENKVVTSNGQNIDSFYVKLKLKAIVCDAPARAFLKGSDYFAVDSTLPSETILP